MGEAEDTYPKPPHGWTCFHCGETFTTVGSARDHFGHDPLADPACRIKLGEERGLAMALRRAEAELARYRAEDSDKDREMAAMRADHARALVREEEKGYERGLRDGREEAAQLVDQCNREGPYNAIGAASRIRAGEIVPDTAGIGAALDRARTPQP